MFYLVMFVCLSVCLSVRQVNLKVTDLHEVCLVPRDNQLDLEGSGIR